MYRILSMILILKGDRCRFDICSCWCAAWHKAVPTIAEPFYDWKYIFVHRGIKAECDGTDCSDQAFMQKYVEQLFGLLWKLRFVAR